MLNLRLLRLLVDLRDPHRGILISFEEPIVQIIVQMSSDDYDPNTDGSDTDVPDGKPRRIKKLWRKLEENFAKDASPFISRMQGWHFNSSLCRLSAFEKILWYRKEDYNYIERC